MREVKNWNKFLREVMKSQLDKQTCVTYSTFESCVEWEVEQHGLNFSMIVKFCTYLLGITYIVSYIRFLLEACPVDFYMLGQTNCSLNCNYYNFL